MSATDPSTTAQPALGSPADQRVNFGVHLVNGVLMSGGVSALGLFTALPMLVHEIVERDPRLAPVENLCGAALFTCFIGLSHLAGFAGAGLCAARTRRKPLFLIGMLVGRLGFPVLALAGFAMTWLGYPAYLLVLLLCLVSFALVDGAFRPQWLDFVGRQVPDRRRGRLFAGREIGAALLGGGLIAVFPWLSEVLTFPFNWAVLHALIAGLVLASFFAFLPMREVPYRPEEVAPRPGIIRHMRESLGILRSDPGYRRLLGTMFVLGFVSVGAIALFTLKAANTLAWDAADRVRFTGIVTGLAIATRAGGHLLFGLIADRWTYKHTAFACFGTFVVALALVLLAESELAFLLAIGLASLARCGILFVILTYPLEWAPEHRRPAYNGLMLISTLSYVFGPLLGGFLADQVGYDPVFVLTATLVGFGLVLLGLRVTDPRSRRAERPVAEPALEDACAEG